MCYNYINIKTHWAIVDNFFFFFFFNYLLSWFDSAKAGFQSDPAFK